MKNAIKNGYLVDVRSDSEFLRGNVPGSVNIPLDKIPAMIDMLYSKDNIVVFCQSGGRAQAAKTFLEKNGFRNVVNAGGWESVNAVVGKLN